MELAGERRTAMERSVGRDEKRCKNLRKKKQRSSWRERERTSTGGRKGEKREKKKYKK
jgi:hypothetical protein